MNIGRFLILISSHDTIKQWTNDHQTNLMLFRINKGYFGVYGLLEELSKTFYYLSKL